MAIFRGVGGSGDSSDNSFLQEVTAQANAAEASATSAANSLAAIQETEVTSATFNTSDGVLTLTKTGGATVTADLDGRFLTSYTETNDLSTAVTWANVPDANITESSVTQHLTASNVSAAGALMDSEVTNLAQVKAFDSSDYATSAQGTTADNALPKAGGQMTGNITFSGTQTVDGRDLSVDGAKLDGIEANATADQTGAEIKTAYEAEADTNAFTDADHSKLDNIEANADVTDTANVTSAGAAMLASSPTFTGTITAPNLDISTTGTVTTNIATGNNTSSPSATKTVNIGTGFSGFFAGLTTVNIGTQETTNQNTVNIGSGVSFAGKEDTINLKGNVTVDGTLNGGTYERTVRTRFQRRGYSSVSPLTYLTTTYNQVGSSLRINSGVTTAVENVLDLNITLQFSDINSTNEGLLAVTVDAPNPSNETTVNLGTVTSTSQGIFKVTGDFTKHFSPYCGMSTNSDGSNSFTFTNYEGWHYDPVNDETSVFYNPFQVNTPSLGDTVYLHPFDWETQGTEIYGEIQPIEAYNASGTVHQNQFHQIYLGYYKPERTFKIKAKETTASENIAVTRLAGSYSQIIGG